MEHACAHPHEDRAPPDSTPAKKRRRRRWNSEGIELGFQAPIPKRRSVPQPDAALHALADLLVAGQRTLVISGAGLSCASGIPPFRATSDAVWSRHVQEMGTRAAFLRDPCRWYNEFWLPNFAPQRLAVRPNAGHEAIAGLASMFADLRVVTQNIDGLHQATATQWPARERLIEAHGDHRLFKCGSDPDDEANECPFASERSIHADGFTQDMRRRLGRLPGDDGRTSSPTVADATGGSGDSPSETPPLQQVPKCPHCGHPVMPQALLFDEDYTDHEFYQFEKLQSWLDEAQVLIFVGTSFAVTLTAVATEAARKRKVPVFNVNITVDDDHGASPTLNWQNIVGPAETELPKVLRLCQDKLRAAGRPVGAGTAAAEGEEA